MTQSRTRAPQGERAERKRQAILEAARDVFLRNGFAAGIDTVAAAANVSKVTIYNHFGSKEELFVAVIVAALQDALADAHTVAGQNLLEEQTPARESLARMARAWVQGLTDPEVAALRALVVAERTRFPELGSAWEQAGPQSSDPILRNAFQLMVDRGELRVPDMDLAILQFYGLVLYPHLVRSAYGTTLDAETTEKLIVSGVDMLVTYYGADR